MKDKKIEKACGNCGWWTGSGENFNMIGECHIEMEIKTCDYVCNNWKPVVKVERKDVKV